MNDILLLGIFLSLIFTELTDLSPGGIIVPAYFAMYAYDWKRLLGTIILALLCMLIVHFMSKYMILYGRRRYAVYIMTGVLLKFLIGSMGAVPDDSLTWGSRRNQLRRGHGSPPVLSEVPHELSIPMRTPKSANGPRSNSFRPDFPSATNLPTGTEDSASSPHHTGHGPFRTRPPNLS